MSLAKGSCAFYLMYKFELVILRNAKDLCIWFPAS
jgi:hypothetical protein